jgi:hypothetical protein
MNQGKCIVDVRVVLEDFGFEVGWNGSKVTYQRPGQSAQELPAAVDVHEESGMARGWLRPLADLAGVRLVDHLEDQDKIYAVLGP